MEIPFVSTYYPLLIRGDYESIVQSALDQSPGHRLALEDVPWVMGALSFLGRTWEAQGLFQAHQSSMDPLLKIPSRFFLGVALCRAGQYTASRQLLFENVKDARDTTNLLCRFFACQGFAFYRYSTGRLGKAQVWAEAALRASSGAPFVYGQALAFELLGHVQLSAGQFHAGFRHLNLAKKKAMQLGQGALLQAIDISIVLYRASYGIAQNSRELTDLLISLMDNELYQDSYTQAALNLELARIYTLRGELSRAKEQLEVSSELVYRIDNPELETDYNLQQAQLLRSQGELHQALSLVRGAKHRSNASLDVRARLKVHGFESQLLKALGRVGDHEALNTDIARLSRMCGTLMAERYLRRHQNAPPFHARSGEDVLGDLIDRISSFKESVVADLLRSEWFGLLSAPLNVLPSESVLYFDAEPGSLTIFHKGEVQHLRDGCSTLLRKFLILLSQRSSSKETIANHIWHQAYNPLRHDGLIYPLVAKARKLLGKASDWIEVHESGYRLRTGVRVVFARVSHDEPDPPPRSEDDEERFGMDERQVSALNSRQRNIWETLKNGHVVEPAHLVKCYGVSDATVTRDMTKLMELGLAKRVGRGRATRYHSETQEK